MTKEERVVKMEFDNKQFEQGVKTSMESLDKLDKALNFDDATQNLSKFKGMAKAFNLDSIASAADTISSRFSNMGIIGMTALQNITNSAINAGKNLVKSFTIDSAKTGFEEYETKMGSVQTILSNTRDKGTTLEDVNDVLNRLNTYSDKTIYNFAEMARNIGTFTAAGIEIDTSASAIEGIANLAAASGSSSQQASTAMYQLSQALAAGKVGLQDWNSVVNAGMGGQLFQKALQDTAREHGIAVDEIIEKNGSFRESLKDDWINAEILTETLNKFTVDGAEKYSKAMMDAGKWTQAEADALVAQAKDMEGAAQDVKTFTQLMDTLKESAQSGWSQTWEILLGDFTQAKGLFTAINNAISPIISASADARNNLLSTWASMGGRDDLIEALSNAFGGLKKIVTSVKEAIEEVFPPLTADKLFKITASVKKFSEHLKISDDTAKKIKSTVKGALTIVSWIPKTLFGIIKIASPLLGIFGKIGKVILNLTSKFGEFTSSINDNISTSFNLDNITNKLSETFNKYVPILKNFGTEAYESFTSFGSSVYENVSEVLQKIPDWSYKAWTSIKGFVSKTKDGMINFGKSIGENFTNAIKSVKDFITGFKDGISDISSSIDLSFITKPIKVIIDKIKNLKWEEILDFGKVGFIGFLIKKISGIGESSGVTGISSLTDIIPGIQETIESLTGALDSVTKKNSAESINSIAKSITILAGAMLLVSKIESDKLVSSGTAIASVLVSLLGSSLAVSKINKNMGDVASTLLVFKSLSKSILVMAISMRILGSLSWEQIIAGATAIATTITIMIGAAALANKNKLSMDSMSVSMIKVGISSIFYAFALKKMLDAMTGAIDLLGSMNVKEMWTGIRALGTVMLMIGGFMTLTSAFVKNASGVKEISKSVLFISLGFRVLSEAISVMGKMNFKELAKGLGAVLIMLVSFGLLSNYGKVKDNMISMSVAMVIMSSAMIVLAGAVKLFSMMSIQEIAIGIGAIAGAILSIGIAMKQLNGGLKGAMALTLITASLVMFVPVIALLGNMDLKVIGTALLALAGTFAVLGVSALLLKPLSPTILALAASLLTISASIALVGAGFALIGAGLASIAIGFTTLAGLGAVGAMAVVSALEIIVTGIAQFIPTVVSAIAGGLKMLLISFIDLQPTFTELLLSLIMSLASVIKLSSGIIFEALGVFLTELLKFLDTMIDPFLDFIDSFIDKVLAHMTEETPGFIDSVAVLIVTIVESMADAINNHQEELAEAINDLINGLIDFMLSLVTNAIGSMKDKAKELMESGFIQGIRDKLSSAKAAVTNFISECKRKITDKINDFKEAGKDLLQGFIDGLVEKATAAVDNIKKMANNVVDTAKQIFDINSPSRVFHTIGSFVVEGFIGGLESLADKVVDTTTNMGKEAIDSTNKAVSDTDIWSDVFDINPTITPDVDLSLAEAAANRMNKLFNNKFNSTISRDMDGDIQYRMNRTRIEKDNQNGTSNTYNNSNSYDNTFVIHSTDPEQVAKEVDHILQNKMERRRAVWQ